MAATTINTPSGSFDIEVSERSLERNLPQRVGRRLWLPMLAMALMGFAAALAVGAVRGTRVADGGDPQNIEALRQLTAGLMFLGFAAVFAAISLTIARILGELRKGGGDLQEAAGRVVRTLRMPPTAKVFLGLMAMATMSLVAAVVAHLGFAVSVSNGSTTLADSDKWFVVLEGVRRAGVAVYLLAIVLGLATISHVLRFQTIRLRELPAEPRAADR